MDTQTILVYIIVLLCVIYAGRHFLKFFKKKKPGQTDCGRAALPEVLQEEETGTNRLRVRMRMCRMPERETQETLKTLPD